MRELNSGKNKLAPQNKTVLEVINNSKLGPDVDYLCRLVKFMY